MANQPNVRRKVKVYLSDPDSKVPIEKCVLDETAELLTEATDQELFFSLNVTEKLEAHNTYRSTVIDKDKSMKMGKDVFLEPIRIRDLRMTVVNIATLS